MQLRGGLQSQLASTTGQYNTINLSAYLQQVNTTLSINLREALARNAGDLETRVFMAATFVAAGDLQAAEWEAEEIRALRSGFTARRWLETGLMADERQKRRLTDLLAKVGL